MTDHPAPNPNQPDALAEKAARVIERETDEPTWSAIVIARAVLAAVLPEVERHAKADALREAADFTAPGYRGPLLSRQWLRARADQIEKESDR